jgi:NADP-dependent 3-hydroxy acid dehydrogenase YdfG
MTKCAVVTGASSGIGKATVQRLRQSGWDVVAVARREPQLAALASETGCQTAVLDVTDLVAVESFADQLPACDALINVAGGAFDADSVSTGSPESWLSAFRVNVMGTLAVTQALLPKLHHSDSATIVNVTSTAAYVNYENGGSYSAAKHAEHALTETLRLELSGAPIRVIEIQPGMVHTDEFALNRFGGDAEKAAAVYEDVDRPLTAEDVAECIGWASELPIHINVDRLTVRPLAQAAQHKVFRGPLFTT